MRYLTEIINTLNWKTKNRDSLFEQDLNIVTKMTDSDDSYELPNNIFAFQNGSTTVCAKGPNINNTNISSLGFRNNMSTIDMRHNLKRPRYAESAFDQRSLYSRRETSPMSLCSASRMQARNFGPLSSHHGGPSSYHQGGMSSQRSVYYNQRSRSPLSVRSNVSNVTAMDIVTAIFTNKFNRQEWKDIKYAFYKKVKHRDRNRVRKRRNIRMFLKGTLNRSGGESGEQGSNSSISDDDCRSVRSYRTTGTTHKGSAASHRLTRSYLPDFRRTMQKSSVYRDCTDSFRQNTFRNMFPVAPSSKENTQSRSQYYNSVTIQKDRFKNGFLLPSQRFNQSVASSTIPEKVDQWQRNNEDQLNMRNGNVSNKHRAEKIISYTDSEQEEIFSETRYGNSSQSKRHIYDNDDTCLPDKKRSRLLTSPKNNAKSKAPGTKQTNTMSKGNRRSNDFVFPKPQFPIKKLGNLNNQIKGPSKLTQASKMLDSKSQQESELSTDISIQRENLILSCPQNTKTNSKSSQLADTNAMSENNERSNDSVFAKPQLPLRKSGNIKNHIKVTSKSTQSEKKNATKSSQQSTSTIQQPESLVSKCQNIETMNPKSDMANIKSQQPEEKCLSKSQQLTEKLISKSRQPLYATDYPTDLILPQNDNVRDQNKDLSETIQHSTTDVSMRPSFIKRKLFTQKIDLAENKNSSSENLDANSPQTDVYSAIQKEKSKTRKLVASQSCLNRDVFGDDSNLLDLIHKIVPAERMNLTTTTNRSEARSNKSKLANADKWDISKVIQTCNNTGDGSDTYTDEEIFKADEVKNTGVKKKTDEKQKQVAKKCVVVEEKLQQNLPLDKVNELDSAEERHECNKRNLFNCVKSFWDTDSDDENNLESRNETTNEKCNEKESQRRVTSNQNSKSDKENRAPITNTTSPPTKSPLNKTAASVRKNNKKPRNTKNTNSIAARSKTSEIDKIKNTEVATFPDSKSAHSRVKAAQKPRDNAKNIPKTVQTEIGKLNPTVKTKQIDKTLTHPKSNKKKTLNNNLVLENVDSLQKVNNSTLNSRPLRKARLKNNNLVLENVDTLQKVNNTRVSSKPLRKTRIKLCCVQSSETEKSLNDTSANDSSGYRSLRSRVIDLSTSVQSKNNKSLNKNVRGKKENYQGTVDNFGQSDVSFTLTTDKTPNKRPSRLRNNIGRILMTTRQNDMSFSLTSDKSLNKTVTATNNKELCLKDNSKMPQNCRKKETESFKIDLSLAKANKKRKIQ